MAATSQLSTHRRERENRGKEKDREREKKRDDMKKFVGMKA